MLFSILNYVLAIGVGVLAVLLLLRYSFALIQLEPSIGKEYDRAALKSKLTALAFACEKCERKGYALGTYKIERAFNRFYKSAKTLSTPHEFEMLLISGRRQIMREIRGLNKSVALRKVLPHSGGYPRIYLLCKLIISGLGGYVDEQKMKECVQNFTAHARLEARELQVLAGMVRLCCLQQLAFFAEHSRKMSAVALRAERDAKAEKMDLTHIKYGAYVNAYTEKADGKLLGTFNSVCLENGLDVAALKREFINDTARNAYLCKSLITCLERLDEWLTDEFTVGLLDYVAAPCSGFAALSAKDKFAAIEAAEKTGNKLKGKTFGELTSAAAPSGFIIALAAVAILALFISPLVAAVIIRPTTAVFALLALPPSLWTAVFVIRRTLLSRLIIGREIKSAELSEFALDATFEGLPVKKGIGKRARGAAINVAKESQAILRRLYPVTSLLIALLSPLSSALWLMPAFLPQIAEAVFRPKNFARNLMQAVFLPSRALWAVLGSRSRRFVAPLMQLSAAAASALIILLGGAGFAFYALPAAFIAAPVATTLRKRLFKKRTGPLPKAYSRQYVFGAFGTYPRVRFLTGGEFITCVGDNGSQFDSFGDTNLTEDMAVYIGNDRLKTTMPFIAENGRTINNMLFRSSPVYVETCASCFGGKTVTVGGIEKGVTCKHILSGEFETVEQTDSLIILKKTDGIKKLYFAAAITFGKPLAAKIEKQTFFTLSLTSQAYGGKCGFAFFAGYDLGELKKRTAAAMDDSYGERTRFGSAEIERSYKLRTADLDVAAFIIYGNCRYDRELEKYMDTRYNTVLCYLRDDAEMQNLYRNLNGLAELKRLGLKFNVVVMGFFRNRRFREIESELGRTLERLSLTKNGRAEIVNCDKNSALYEKLTAACPVAEQIRFVQRQNEQKRVGIKRAFVGLPSASGKLSKSAHFGKESKITSFDGLSFVICSDGRGFTLEGNPWTGKLTAEIPRFDSNPSECVVFAEDGREWSATLLPCGEAGEWACRHKADETVFECGTNAWQITQRAYLSEGGRAKIWDITAYNPRSKKRKMDMTFSVRAALGGDYEETKHYLKVSEESGGASVMNMQSGKQLFLYCDGDCTLKAEDGECAVLFHTAFVPPKSSYRVRFALTDNDDFDLFKEEKIERTESAVQIESPDYELNCFVNGLPSRIKSAVNCPSECSGGVDFASPLIGTAAIAYEYSERQGQAIIAAVKKRFRDGSILQRVRGGYGVKSPSDAAALVLPIAVARYIDVTDDRDILYERTPLLEVREGGIACSAHKEALLGHCISILLSPQTGSYNGIASDLLKIMAITNFLPLVRSVPERMELVNVRTAARKRAENADFSRLCNNSLSFAVLCGLDGIAARTLSKRAEKANDADKLLLCAALMYKGETEGAYEIYRSLVGGDWAEDTASAAMSRLLFVEGFLGIKLKGGCLKIEPNLPKAVEKITASLKFGDTRFSLRMDGRGEGEYSLHYGGICYNRKSVEITDKLNGKTLEIKRRKN